MEGVKIRDIAGYRDRMSVTMTLAEKLFFVNQLDLYSYSTIIDFGGADGALIHHIQELFPDLAERNQFIIVDNCPQMFNAYPLKHTIRVKSLEELTYNNYLKDGEVLLICNSVLHECSEKTVDEIVKFANKYARTVVMRDMAFTDSGYKTDHDLTLADFENWRAFDMIKLNPDWFERFKQMLVYTNKWRLDVPAVLTQFILKYTYIDNWNSEVLENYFSNNILTVADKLTNCGWLSLYRRDYPLPYKSQIANWEFNTKLRNTHSQIILEKHQEAKSYVF